MILDTLFLINLLLNTCLSSSTLKDTFFISYNYINISEVINLGNIIIINNEVKTQALHFIGKNGTNYHTTLFNQILKDTNIIEHKYSNLGITDNKIKKRETLINLGLVSEYLGLASTKSTNELSLRLFHLEHDINDGQSSTKKLLNNFSEQLAILQRWHEFEKNRTLSSARSLFFFLKLTHITSHLKSTITDIEIAQLSWQIGKPNNIIFDKNLLDKNFQDIDNKKKFPLFQANNFTQIGKIKNSLHFEIKNNFLIQTAKIPLIYYTDICTKKTNDTLNCLEYTISIKKSDCKPLGKKSNICLIRPCKTINPLKIICNRISDNSYVLDSRQEPCSLGFKNSKIGKNILLNKKQVIYLEHSTTLICNGLEIPFSSAENRTENNHFIYELNSNLMYNLNLTVQKNHRLYTDMEKFVAMNEENKKILNSKKIFLSNDHISIITLTNSLTMGIIIALICSGTIIYYYKNKISGRVSAETN